MTSDRVINFDITPEVSVWCDREPNGTYVLDWTECDNPETYVELEHALARVAALVRAVRTERLLAVWEPGSFATQAEAFVEHQVETVVYSQGQAVRVHGTTEVYLAEFRREERNTDGRLNGVALVRITQHSDPRVVGTEIHVGISILERA